MVGDEHHGDAHLAVKSLNGGEHLAAACGVQHGGGLVKDDALGRHGDDARNGDALLLTAREKMGCVAGEGVHAHGGESFIHAAANVGRGDAQILEAEGHILLHHVGDDLVVGVLEHHAHGAANGDDLLLIQRVHSRHEHPAARGQQHRVHMLGEGGFARAVVSQHRHKAALFDGKVNVAQRHRALLLFLLLGGISKGQVTDFYHSRHNSCFLMLW